ncbi:tetratricopeptide repeat protein [Pseudodesulfovibrio portus]|uniref:tetratricopeptide repeat protein n=1 Tax=Pseudodesulfovibrio portus TaxID=231439 RepID=UPI00222F43E7|nr:tetratricopeptide repeat protein [Pseudodesulfovibrio portus]
MKVSRVAGVSFAVAFLLLTSTLCLAQSGGDVVGAFLQAAGQKESRGDFDGALVLYEKARAFKPADPQVLNGLGRTYLAKRNYEKALSFFRESVAKNKDNVAGYCNLAQLFEATQRYDDAMSFYKAALAIAPHDPRVLNRVGLLCIKRNRPHEAMDFFNLAIKSDPKAYYVYMNRARLLIGMRSFKGAIVNLDYLITQGRRSADVYFSLGVCFNGLGKPEMALKLLAEAEKLGRPSHVIWGEMGRAYLQLPDPEGARNAKRMYIRALQEKRLATYHANLGSALLRLDENGQATRQFEKALQLDSANGMNVNNLATAYFKSGEKERALAILDQGLRASPSLMTMHYNKAMILKEMGRAQEAAAIFVDLAKQRNSKSIAELAELQLQKAE